MLKKARKLNEEAVKTVKRRVVSGISYLPTNPLFYEGRVWLSRLLRSNYYYGNYAIWMLNLAVQEAKRQGYMDRVFSRDSFFQSVGEAAPKNLMVDK